ncbi:MAG: hypothetical protein JSR68_05165 [Proteobacteria bacterium]|nr:hypothetical protein [Pseudomonadota bacterium]
MPHPCLPADDGHDTTLLASSPLGQVLACPGCGVVHLNLPAVTLRLEPVAFDALMHLVVEANRRLHPPAQAEAPRAPVPGWH